MVAVFRNADGVRRTRLSRWVAVLAIPATLVGFAVGNAWLVEAPPNVYVPPADLNLGTVWSDPAVIRTISVHNPTDEPVEVLDIGETSACGCADITPRTFVVPARGATEIELVLHLGAGYGRAPQTDYEIGLVPVLAFEVPGSRIWRLTATVRCPFDVQPGSFSFGGADEVVIAAPRPTAEIVVRPHVEMSAMEATCDPAFGDVRAERSADGSFVVSFTPRNDLAVGEFKSTVELRGIAADGTALPVVKVPVAGTAVPELFLSPAQLQLGAVPLEAEIRKDVLIQSRFGVTVRLIKVESVFGDAVASPGTESGSSAAAIVVAVTPRTIGPRSGKVVVVVESNGVQLDLELPVSYYGVQ